MTEFSPELILFSRMNDTGERRSTRAETEARKLREECSRQRSVIASLKGTISNLQQQMSAQETKCLFQF